MDDDQWRNPMEELRQQGYEPERPPQPKPRPPQQVPVVRRPVDELAQAAREARLRDAARYGEAPVIMPAQVHVVTRSTAGDHFNAGFFGCMGKLAAAVVVIVVLIVIGRMSGPSSSPVSPRREDGSGSDPVAAQLGAWDLAKEYVRNEVAADQKYKGRVITVGGVVKSIGRDITDQAYITLATEESFTDVQCLFLKGNEAQVAGLKVGDGAIVAGECNGKLMNVFLKRCTVIKRFDP